jgi:hypothetical protein
MCFANKNIKSGKNGTIFYIYSLLRKKKDEQDSKKRTKSAIFM